MTSPVKPVAKCVYVCDDVVSDPASGKVSVLNLWDTVRVPVEAGFPYVLGKLCVFVWWRGGAGQVNTRVEVVQASSNEVIRRTGDAMLNFTRKSASLHARYRIEQCVFPEAGAYLVEVYCEDEFVDDQLIRVIQE